MLVEKALGYGESLLVALLVSLLWTFVAPRNLGLVSGAHGLMRLSTGLVRIPHAAFASWDRIPGRRIPQEPIAGFAPDLAADVLSRGNTPAEMARKRQEYFSAGVRLVWLVDPVARTVTVFTQADRSTVLGEGDILDGGDLLRWVRASAARLFQRARFDRLIGSIAGLSVGRLLGCKPPPHRILGHGAGQQELLQVIRAAGLGADARELEPAERLAIDEGAGDRAVDVEVADPELAFDPLDIRRAARIEAAGQGVDGPVGDRERLVEIGRAKHRQDRAEDLFLGDPGVGADARR